MAQKPNGKSSNQQKVQFTRPAAERIARVVRQVELGNRGTQSLSFTPRQRVGNGGGIVFRVGTHDNNSWSKGASKTVTFITVTTTPNTASALNLFADIATGSTGRAVAIAKDGTGWYLIAAECE